MSCNTPVVSMAAAAVIVYRPEKAGPTDNLGSPTEPQWKILKQTAAQTAFVLDAKLHQNPVTDAAPNLPTEEALSLEIEKLCSATLAIDEAFYDIGKRLSDASGVQSKRVDIHDTCYALEAQWSEHHLMYQSLLWRSREFAGEAQSIVDEFRELVLTSLRDPDITQSEKQEIIREQIQLLQGTSQPSQNLCQEFLNFGRSLDTYITCFSEVVENLEIGKQSNKVDELREGLAVAKTAMETLSQEVKGLGWKFAADVAVTGISLLLAFVIPTLWARIADVATLGVDCVNVKNSGLRLLELRRQRDVAVNEYQAVKAEYDMEDVGLGQMMKLENALDAARPQVQDVTTKLGVFASVWAAITADMRKLKNALHRAEDPTSKLFVQRVQRLEKMYGYLSQALRHYQVTVRLT